MFFFVFITIKNRVVEEVHLGFRKAHSGVVISLSGVLKTHPTATEDPLVATGAHPVDEESHPEATDMEKRRLLLGWNHGGQPCIIEAHPLAMSARPGNVDTTTRAIEAHLAL
jgi:hypothetical protein